MNLIRLFFTTLGFFCIINTYAQDSTLIINLAVNASASTGPTPFWMHANKSESIPIDRYYASGQWGVYKTYNANNPRLLQWSGGAELITNYSGKGDVFFTDLYLAGKIGPVEILAGQKKGITGLVDTTLTSGALSVSGNARPIPGLKISIPEFLPLAFTNNFVAIKGSYSDGKLGGSRILYGSVNYVSNTYFHQKQLYFRLGNSESRLKIYAGINHQVVWGGENKIWPLYNLKPADAYWRVVTGKTLDFKKVGNHFGTYDLAAEWKGDKWSFFLYHQSIFENGSLFKVINLSDGLSGIRIKRNKSLANRSKLTINTVTVEVIGTNDQMNQFSSPTLSVYEVGNYFNHYIYARGWSYYGRSIGTPLISEKGTTDSNLDQYNSQFTNNNRFWAFHAGLSARWLNADFLFKSTYTRNYGTYLHPFDTKKDQISLLLMVEKRIKFLNQAIVSAGVASDIGKLYPNSTSLVIGVRKSRYLK